MRLSRSLGAYLEIGSDLLNIPVGVALGAAFGAALAAVAARRERR